MARSLCGIGICDVKGSVTVDGESIKFKSYTCWGHMLERCYSARVQARNPTYIGCSVAKEWLTYSNFKAFFDDNYVDGWQLDKDLLLEDNKIYSPETCTFVPQALNTLFLDSAASRGKFPIGVSFNNLKKKYQARCRANGKLQHIGQYTTPEAASKAYQVFKKGYVLGEVTAYRDAYSDNVRLMKPLDVIESRTINGGKLNAL